MNRRQLLTAGALGLVAPKAMATPTPPEEVTEVTIAIIDPGEYTMKVVGCDVHEDRIVVKVQMFAPIEFVKFTFTSPAADRPH